jgi:hypothetical protein
MANGYRIEYGPVGGSTSTQDVADDVFTYDQISLDPGTEYQARVRYFEDDVNSDWTDWVTVQTLAEQTITLTKASLSLTGKTFYAHSTVDLDKTTITFSPKGIPLIEYVSPLAATINLTGKSIFVVHNAVIGINAAQVNLAGKGIKANSTIDIDTARLEIAAKALAANSTVEITKGAITIAPKTVGAISGEVVELLAATINLTGKAMTHDDTVQLASATLNIIGKTFNISDGEMTRAGMLYIGKKPRVWVSNKSLKIGGR